MKRNQRGVVNGAEIIASLIILGFAVVIGMIFSSVSCSSRWDKSGMQHSWGPIQGCLVKTPNGRWIPEDRVREVDLEVKPK